MRVLVTGTAGQVAQSLKERAALAGVDLVAVGRPEFDLTNSASIEHAIKAAAPDVVVSAAAYTAVDQAEEEQELVYSVNATGAGAVAAAAASIGVPVIHLSTDYVFSGTAEVPYRESDETAPRTVYGQSKLAGEVLVANANPRHVILRTAWVYSPFGRNFVKTMLRLAREREEVRIVSDQWGNPTSALDIADGILHIAHWLQEDAAAPTGTYHLAGTGEASWSLFAEHIMSCSDSLGGPSASWRSEPKIIRPRRTGLRIPASILKSSPRATTGVHRLGDSPSRQLSSASCGHDESRLRAQCRRAMAAYLGFGTAAGWVICNPRGATRRHRGRCPRRPSYLPASKIRYALKTCARHNLCNAT